MIYGYARVSTTDQDHTGQVDALKAAGAAKIFAEKMSGANADRRQLKRAITALDAGDVLLVTRIDRLARSTRDLLNVVQEIKEAGASFQSLAEPWANTDSEMAEFMLTIVGAVAKLERSFILARTADGRTRAKAKGKSLGRPFKLTPTQRAEARDMIAKGRSTPEVAEIFNVSPATIWRLGQ